MTSYLSIKNSNF